MIHNEKRFQALKQLSNIIGIIGICCVTILGCVGQSGHQQLHRLQFDDDVDLRLNDMFFSPRQSFVQQVTFSQGDKKLEFIAMVEISDNQMKIAGLSVLFGNRLFLLQQDNEQFSYEGTRLFELPFDAKYLIRDFWLIYAKPDHLQQRLGEIELQQYDITSDDYHGVRRTFSLAHEVLVQIEYSEVDFLAASVVLKNRKIGYTISVTTSKTNP